MYKLYTYDPSDPVRSYQYEGTFETFQECEMEFFTHYRVELSTDLGSTILVEV
jgi:hypothetical protein